MTEKKSEAVSGEEAELEQIRSRIGDIDAEIIELLETRTQLARRAGEMKRQSEKEEFVNTDQSERVIERARQYAATRDVDENVITAVFRLFIHMSMVAEWEDVPDTG